MIQRNLTSKLRSNLQANFILTLFESEIGFSGPNPDRIKNLMLYLELENQWNLISKCCSNFQVCLILFTLDPTFGFHRWCDIQNERPKKRPYFVILFGTFPLNAPNLMARSNPPFEEEKSFLREETSSKIWCYIQNQQIEKHLHFVYFIRYLSI